MRPQPGGEGLYAGSSVSSQRFENCLAPPERLARPDAARAALAADVPRLTGDDADRPALRLHARVAAAMRPTPWRPSCQQAGLVRRRRSARCRRWRQAASPHLPQAPAVALRLQVDGGDDRVGLNRHLEIGQSIAGVLVIARVPQAAETAAAATRSPRRAAPPPGESGSRPMAGGPIQARAAFSSTGRAISCWRASLRSAQGAPCRRTFPRR
jgi:hypothetical protein